MICVEQVKRYCSNYEQIENYQEAISSTEKWDCHHRNEIDMKLSLSELKETGLYYDRPASELIFLTHEAHTSLHKKGNKIRLGKHHSIEAKKKLSDALKGNKNALGYKHSEESKIKMSKNHARLSGSKHPRYKFICPIKLTYMYCKLGMSIDKIAQELGCGHNTINRHLKELNIKKSK